jgi:hypothetical protein
MGASFSPSDEVYELPLLDELVSSCESCSDTAGVWPSTLDPGKDPGVRVTTTFPVVTAADGPTSDMGGSSGIDSEE